MDRALRLWFWIRNWLSNLLLRYFAASPPDRTEHEPPPIDFSSPSKSGVERYEVFVSFRGEDTRRGFTSHLCDSLSSKLGISLVFKDEVHLEKGASIAPELLKAIEDSRIAVVVLSRNYASSTWCLDELVHILQQRPHLVVVPIFYEVDPSDVRKQKGGSSFGDAFAKHDRVFAGAGGKVREWRAALTEVANLSGFDTAYYRNDSAMIKDIVGKIWKELSPTFPSISKPLVGIDRRKEAVIELLGLDSAADQRNDVRIIGICGMGGSGKTTVAMAVYDTIRSRFEFSTYISRVREACNTHGGLLQLQKQLFSELAGNTTAMAGAEAWPEFGGIEKLKRVFRGKKLLLIVDDVTHQKQLQYLAVEHSLFGLGSRVIITCRDLHLLNAVRVDCIYETQLMDHDEARTLLSLKAFSQEEPLEDYRYVCEEILDYAGGLPLALEVLGSSLRGRSVAEYRSMIEKLKRIPPGEILEVLKVSYDALDDEEKQMFLDFVFFFNGLDLMAGVVDSWFNMPLTVVENLYPDAEIGIRNLNDKALLQVEGNFQYSFSMHHLLEEMGRAIVCSECPNEPGLRSRLTGYQDVCHVLSKETGSEKVEIISLRSDYEHPEIKLNSGEAFSRMSSLIVLELKNVKIKQGPNYLSDELRFLSWSHYPSESLPQSFNPQYLFLLQLDFSINLKRLWHGNKAMPYLTCLILRCCDHLIETPDFSTTPNLEMLSFDGCVSLREVHPSFGHLKKLVLASFGGCASLEVLPKSLETTSLEFLSLQGCSNLKRFPSIESHMDRLVELQLQGTAIELLDATIGRLVGLTKLNLNNCECLKSLPDSLGSLTSLEELDLNGCCELEELPSLRRCISLKHLLVEDCTKLGCLPELPPYLGRLKAKGCKSLEGIPDTISQRSDSVNIDCRRCFKLDRSESLGWRMLQRFLQGNSSPEQEFGIVTPAGTNQRMEIPEWLSSSSHRFSWGLFEQPPHDVVDDASNPDWIGTVEVLCFRIDDFDDTYIEPPCRERCIFCSHLNRRRVERQSDADEERHIWLSYVPKGDLRYYIENHPPVTEGYPVFVCPHIAWDWCEYRNIYRHEVEEWKKQDGVGDDRQRQEGEAEPMMLSGEQTEDG